MKPVGEGAFLLASALAVSAAVPATAQSLGEAARRERERRAKEGRPPAPAYDDAELEARRAGRPASPSPSPSPSPSASPSPKVGDDEAAVRKRQEAEWRERFAKARERVALAEEAAWHEVVETVFVSGIPVQQRVRKFEETESLRQARQALAELEEDYRRTGLPPGWVRD
jgi:hypothetical protein